MDLSKFKLDKLEEFTSKSSLQQILQVSSATIHSYANVALFIPDFESDYPSMIKGGAPDTSAYLTRYQCWVIYGLMLTCNRLKISKVSEALRTNIDPEFTSKFSKESFLARNKNNGNSQGLRLAA